MKCELSIRSLWTYRRVLTMLWVPGRDRQEDEPGSRMVHCTGRKTSGNDTTINELIYSFLVFPGALRHDHQLPLHPTVP